MKTTLVRWITAPLAMLLICGELAAMPPQTRAAAMTTARPIADFVNAQGTFDLGVLFVPPVPNFLGWCDPDSQLCASADYAGLANQTCNGVAGTTFAGKVREKLLPDGRAEVKVELFTQDAITWVVGGFDFANDPVIFGVRWQDVGGDCVLDGAPALGSSLLEVTLINAAPGAPLPDLIQLVAAPEPGQELRAISIHAEAIGKLTDGTWARAEADQVARLKDGELTFSLEKVAVHPLPGKLSIDVNEP
jgi:hypothetical protein